MKNTLVENQNILTMVGNTDGTLKNILDKAIDKVTLSSGSWNSPFCIFEGNKLVGKFDSKGNTLAV